MWLRSKAEARAPLHHILEHADIVGTDTVGRTIIQLAVDDRALEMLITFDAEAVELEPEPDDEEDGPPVLMELVRPKVVERRPRSLYPCLWVKRYAARWRPVNRRSFQTSTRSRR